MPRANRHFLPGYIWHITHRCHQRKFLLKFARDRQRYCHWLFEAKKRFGLCVLDYIATSNHVHLLIKDTGTNVIAESMQLIRIPKPVPIVPNVQALRSVQNVTNQKTLQRTSPAVEQGLENGLSSRDDRWSESIAVGSLSFVDTVKSDLGMKASHRGVIEANGSYALREPAETYGVKFSTENEALRRQNTFFWDETVDQAKT